MLTILSSSTFSLWRRRLLPMILSCQQMQALFASTRSFKVKRGASNLLRLSDKYLLVIPPRSLKARDCLYTSLWMNSFKKLDQFLSVFFRRTGSNYPLWPRHSTHKCFFCFFCFCLFVCFFFLWQLVRQAYPTGHCFTVDDITNGQCVCERHERKEEISNGQKFLPHKLHITLWLAPPLFFVVFTSRNLFYVC